MEDEIADIISLNENSAQDDVNWAAGDEDSGLSKHLVFIGVAIGVLVLALLVSIHVCKLYTQSEWSDEEEAWMFMNAGQGRQGSTSNTFNKEEAIAETRHQSVISNKSFLRHSFEMEDLQWEYYIRCLAVNEVPLLRPKATQYTRTREAHENSRNNDTVDLNRRKSDSDMNRLRRIRTNRSLHKFMRTSNRPSLPTILQ